MRNQSIIVKLFFVLTICFMLFVGSSLYFQRVYFQKYYQEVKTKEIELAADNFVELFKYTNWTIEEIKVKSKIFEQSNQVKMGVLDSNGDMLNEENYTLSIKDYSGRNVDIELNSLFSENDYLSKDIKIGAVITSEGYYLDDRSKFVPMKIYVNNQQWVDYSSKFIYSKDNRYSDKISGRLYSYLLPKAEELINGIDKRDLWGALDFYNTRAKVIIDENPELLKNPKLSFIYNSNILNQKNTVMIMDFSKNGNYYKLIILQSHENLIDAMTILEDYYIYVLGAAFALVVIISVLFSIIVSKPLLQINEYAKRMANLEFDTVIPINSNDEIGSLSVSLNTMQSNLQITLSELQVANEKLMIDIEKERELESMRKEFISGVSHEIKTPLAIIKGYSEGIRDGLAVNKMDKYIGIILDEVTKMDILVNDMLDLSKLNQGRKNLEKSMFGFNEIIEDVVEKFSSQLIDKNLSINIESYGMYFEAFADRRRIEQVIKNLISNAVRYSYPSTIINISLSNHESEKVLFNISNESEHIPDEKINKIWEKFYRLDQSRNKSIAGTGLGLSIVKNILELHKSDYGVENIKNGVNFYFSLGVVGKSE